MDIKSDSVSEIEVLTRFIFSTSHFTRKDSRIKYAAFMPYKGKTSVFRTSNLSYREIWNIGEAVGDTSGRSLKARGDILAENVYEQDLKVEPSTSWHHLHADITGWPSERAETKLIAMKLASKAKLILKSSDPQ